MMVLSALKFSESSEQAFGPVGAGPAIRIDLLMIDPSGVEAGVKRIPGWRFISVQDGSLPHATLQKINTITFVPLNCDDGAATAFAGSDNDTALLTLVPRQPSISTVEPPVGRSDVASDITAISLDLSPIAAQLTPSAFRADGMAKFME
jgi:hypothetical protein